MTDIFDRVAQAMAYPEEIICAPGECEDCDSWRKLAKIAARALIEDMREWQASLPIEEYLGTLYPEFQDALDAYAKDRGIE